MVMINIALYHGAVVGSKTDFRLEYRRRNRELHFLMDMILLSWVISIDHNIWMMKKELLTVVLLSSKIMVKIQVRDFYFGK